MNVVELNILKNNYIKLKSKVRLTLLSSCCVLLLSPSLLVSGAAFLLPPLGAPLLKVNQMKF